jgi:recombination associated protein RdgC
MFKNAMIYRVLDSTPFEDPDLLSEKLGEKVSRDPEGSQWRALGFAPPTSFNDELVFTVGKGRLFTLDFAERILPSAVIKEHAAKRIARLENMESRTLYRKEKAQIKDDVIAILLPKSHIKRSEVRYLYHPAGLLILNCSSAKKSEDALAYLRDVLGSLKVVPLDFRDLTMADLMYNILARKNGDLFTDRFSKGDAAKAEDSSGSKVTLKDADLEFETISQLLCEDFTRLINLRVVFHQDDQPAMKLTLTQGNTFKSIKTSSELLAKSEGEEEDGAAIFYADMLLQMDLFGELVETLDSALGRPENKGAVQKNTPVYEDDEL